VTSVHVVRHAKAKNRLEWDHPDEARPLTKRGRREAIALAERLGGHEVVRLVSSPYVRCVQTLEPLALAVDLPIETTELLAEGSAGEDAASLLVSLAGGSDGPIVCSTHGDVLYEVARVVAASGVALPGPWDAPVASAWVFEVGSGAFVGGRFVPPPPR
jgi:phosphohistidine phosphatase SixA